jgi:hypothetical protein
LQGQVVLVFADVAVARTGLVDRPRCGAGLGHLAVTRDSSASRRDADDASAAGCGGFGQGAHHPGGTAVAAWRGWLVSGPRSIRTPT